MNNNNNNQNQNQKGNDKDAGNVQYVDINDRQKYKTKRASV